MYIYPLVFSFKLQISLIGGITTLHRIIDGNSTKAGEHAEYMDMEPDKKVTTLVEIEILF